MTTCMPTHSRWDAQNALRVLQPCQRLALSCRACVHACVLRVFAYLVCCTRRERAGFVCKVRFICEEFVDPAKVIRIVEHQECRIIADDNVPPYIQSCMVLRQPDLFDMLHIPALLSDASDSMSQEVLEGWVLEPVDMCIHMFGNHMSAHISTQISMHMSKCMHAYADVKTQWFCLHLSGKSSIRLPSSVSNHRSSLKT